MNEAVNGVDLSVAIDLRWLHRVYINSPIGAMGGVGTFVQNLWLGLARRWPQLALTALVEHGPLPPRFLEVIEAAPGATVRPVGLSGRAPALDGRGHYRLTLRALETHLRVGMAMGRPGVLHMTDHMPPPRGLRCPTVCSIHEVPVRQGRATIRMLGRMLPPTARATVVAFASAAAQRGYPAVARRPHEVIHYGIDATRTFTPEASDADRDALPGLHGRPFFVHAGILAGRKNPVALLEAFSLVARSCPEPVALLSVGPYQVDPAALSALRALASRMGVGDRLFVLENGASPRQLAAIYRRSLGLVFPSLIEAFGLPAIEALACGAGCVVAARGGLPEVVGELGILVDPGDARSIAGGMIRLLRDAGLRTRVRAQGPAWARRFSVDAMVDAYVRCYQQAVAIAAGHAPVERMR